MDAIDIIMWIAFVSLLVGGIQAAIELPEFLRRPSGSRIGFCDYLLWGVKWALGLMLLIGLGALLAVLYWVLKV